jgi:(p)ppGpp synthase/HD superfamily hydrolase
MPMEELPPLPTLPDSQSCAPELSRSSPELLHIASEFAELHLGQCRRGKSDTAYRHARRVVDILEKECQITEPVVLAVAYLHDVLEDGNTDVDELHQLFGATISRAVEALTKPRHLPKPLRQQYLHTKIQNEGPVAVLVKIADLMDNLRSRRGTSKGRRTALSAQAFLVKIYADAMTRQVVVALSLLHRELSNASLRPMLHDT